MDIPVTAALRARASTPGPRRSATAGDGPASARTAARILSTARGRDFRRALDAMLDALGDPGCLGRIDASLVLDAESAVDGFLARESAGIVTNQLVWSGEDQAFADWSIRACERWAAVAIGFAWQELAAFGAASPSGHRLAAIALASLGRAGYWRAVAGRGKRGLQPLHETFGLAQAAGIARTPVTIRIGGGSACVTPEALYIRALLFDALCAGALSRPEMVVADDWLLLWSGDFRLLEERAGEVAIGIVGEGGLEPSGPEAGPAGLYLDGLDALRSRIAAVRSAFHEGRLVAGTPHAASLPVEIHVSALSRLEELVAFWVAPAAARERRSRASAGRSAPLHTGLAEILARGFGPAVDADPAQESGGDPAPTASSRADRRATYGMTLDPIGFRAIVEDLSARGMGLAVERREDAPAMGDLVAARLGSTLRVGRVVRHFSEPATHRIRIGVSVLADNPARVELLNTCRAAPRNLARAPALYVPGADPGGSEDSIIVSRAAFDAGQTWALAVDGESYAIKLCRDQVCGRGWVAARFEVLEAWAG
jgi:hypothetical protein